MAKQVLQTKMVGYATDRTGHAMAPMEVVYDVEAPARRPIRNAIDFMLGAITVLLCVGGAIAIPLELFGVDVPSIFDLFGV